MPLDFDHTLFPRAAVDGQHGRPPAFSAQHCRSKRPGDLCREQMSWKLPPRAAHTFLSRPASSAEVAAAAAKSSRAEMIRRDPSS